ncbi:MAG: hypothetical protein AAGF23_23275 [Acidobacteriota bacterium]
MSDELSAELFSPYTQQTFRITAGGEAFDAELVEAKGIRSDTERSDKSPFSLLFRAPEGLVFEQQIMTVAHDGAGEHEIFMVPLGPDPDHESRGILYEAVFT